MANFLALREVYLQQNITMFPAVTNARFAAFHGLPVCPVPSMGGGLPSAARRRDVPLRLRFARRFSPPSAPLSPLADRRPKPDNPQTRTR
jgi:hypothetical protein